MHQYLDNHWTKIHRTKLVPIVVERDFLLELFWINHL